MEQFISKLNYKLYCAKEKNNIAYLQFAKKAAKKQKNYIVEKQIDKGRGERNE